MKKNNRKNRRQRRNVNGTGLGRGHGGNSKLPAITERLLSSQERKFVKDGAIEKDTAGYQLGACRISVGSSHLGHHLSIAHPKRYPTWDEIAKARYEILPADKTFGMLFPPDADYVNIHNYCFQLWEVTGLRESRKLLTIGSAMAQALVVIHALLAANDEKPNPDLTADMWQVLEGLFPEIAP